MKKKFLRVCTRKFKRLKRRKNQKWRKAKGHDNKIRLKRKGRPKKVEIGYKQNKENRGKIRGEFPVFIRNLKDAEKINKNLVIVSSKLGKKKRIEIERIIKEKGGEILGKKK